MNYHDIRTDDMLNGEGLRVVLFVSGCNHCCKNCQNPQTWDLNSGIKFTTNSFKEVIQELDKDYISGITFSGGDPLKKENVDLISFLCYFIKEKYPAKTIWLYTGYSFEEIIKDELYKDVLNYIDVLVDGKFVEELSDINCPWVGSTNQRVIDVKKSLDKGEIVLYN